MKQIFSILDQYELKELAIAGAIIVLWFVGLYVHDWTRRFNRRR